MIAIPKFKDFYLFEIKIDTSMLKGHLQQTTKILTIKKCAGGDVLLYTREPNISNIRLPVTSNNMVFNRCDPGHEIEVTVNAQYLTPLSQLGDTSRMLHICVHPNFPVVMFYTIDISSVYRTQYDVPPNVQIHAVTISVCMPQIKSVTN
jgi:hypothetical protein